MVGGNHHGLDQEPEELETEAPSSAHKAFSTSPEGWSNNGESHIDEVDSGGVTSPQSRERRQVDKHRLVTAVLLNKNMSEHSAKARLVVTNLPLVKDMQPSEVLQYVEAVGKGIAPLLMIRGTGVEVVTQYG
ncbi:unnamed protein product [Choristocarpus tenellus]